MPNPSIIAFIVSEISALIWTDGQTDMPRSTRLVIQIKNICIYFMGSETLPSACYILSDESGIPFCSTINGYTKNNNKYYIYYENNFIELRYFSKGGRRSMFTYRMHTVLSVML